MTPEELCAQIMHGTEKANPPEFKNRLGISKIGKECQRANYYEFWNFAKRTFSHRQIRIFESGEFFEKQAVNMLVQAGIETHAIDPNTGDQFLVSLVGGHFDGKLDAIVNLPGLGYGVLEVKSFKQGSDWTQLLKFGVRRTKPAHFHQGNLMAVAYGFKYFLYVAINKNDESLHIEIVDVNENEARERLEVAKRIILEPHHKPERISNKQSYYICKMCDYLGVCFGDSPIEKNCRSCKNSGALEEPARFACCIHPQQFGTVCDNWEPK